MNQLNRLPRILLLAAITLCLQQCFCQFANAQYAPYYNGAFGTYSSYSAPSQLLWNDRNLQKKLDLTRAQRRDLMEIKLDYEDSVEDLQQELNTLNTKRYKKNEKGSYVLNPEVTQQIQDVNKKLREIATDFRARAEKVLLPHQKDTHKQIQFSRLISQGFIRPLTAGSLDSYLEITPEQKKRLKKIKKELDNKMKQSIAEIMDDIKNALLEELSPQQRRKAEEMFKEYEYRGDPTVFSMLQYEMYYFKKKKKSKE